VLVVPYTVALRAVDCPTESEVEVGLSVIDTVGIKSTVAVAVLVGSTTLVAVTVTFCEPVSAMGAVYTPPEVKLPNAGMDHVTPVFAAPVTVGLKTVDCPLVIEIQLGLRETLTSGIKVMVAVSLGLKELVAVTVTWLFAVMVAGAVYLPDAVMLPELGLIDQVYSLDAPLVTENDSLCEGFSVTVAGVSDCACKAAAIEKSIAAFRSAYVARIGIVCCLHIQSEHRKYSIIPSFP
jgi:hypothetical protein